MKPNSASTSRRIKRGSTLMLTLILSTALLVVVAGLMSALTTDKRLNTFIAVGDQARNAAEGAMEVATAEFDRRALSDGTLSDNPLEGFTLPESVRTELSQNNVIGSSIEFKAGNLSPLPDAPEVINPDDPFNAPDPDKGKPVSIRHAFIYGKASAVEPSTGHVVSSYLSTLIQVRTQSWLNYGIFGNLDLEFHAGPAMDVIGPVHSNCNLYLLGGSDLRFFESCTTTRGIYRKFKDNGSISSHGARIKFPPKADALAADLLEMTTTQDSRMTGFKEFAQAKWKGFVQDGTFDVPPFSPPGMLQYVEDDYTTPAIDETRNPAYAYIEPQLATVSSDDAASHVYSGHKGTDIENLKVSAIASLIIRIKPKPSALTEAEWWAKIGKADNDDPDFEPGFELVYHTLSDPSKAPNRTNFPVRDGNGRPVENIIPLTPARMSPELRNRLFAAVRLVRYAEDGTAAIGNGNVVRTEFVTELGGDIANATAGTPAVTSTNRRRWYGIHDRRQGYQYSNAAGATANAGLRGAHHALHIDYGAFNSFLNADAEEWEDQADADVSLYNPSVQWSGVLYVQLPLIPDSDPEVSARKTTDKIRPARRPTNSTAGYAVILRNARRLPGYESRREEDGFVLGCNGSVYVLGHYNADGNSATGSSTEDDAGWDEIPSIIAADAVTLLSQNWATNEASYFSESTKPKKAATFTEFSSAVFAGVVPTRLTTSGTGTNGQRMGGVHNFVRFLENWGGVTYRNRGSLALLFENEVALRPYYEDHHGYWYSPPTRDIGYHIFFANGKSPRAWPPFMRSDRRIKVDRLNEDQYEAGPPTPP